MTNNGEKIRPRLTKEELAFISYALRVLELSAKHKLGELDSLPYDLKKLARIIWFTGDLKAHQIWKPYKKYCLVEWEKGTDVVNLMLNAKTLRRRIEGLLNGRHFHSQEHWRQ